MGKNVNTPVNYLNGMKFISWRARPSLDLERADLLLGSGATWSHFSRFNFFSGDADKIIEITKAYPWPLSWVRKGERMRVRLTPLWSLTDELEDSFTGQAVLVNQGTGEAFGPGDVIKPYSFWELKPAAFHATLMGNIEEHTYEELAFIRRFSLARPG